MHFSKFRGLRFECRDMITFVYITLQDVNLTLHKVIIPLHSIL